MRSLHDGINGRDMCLLLLFNYVSRAIDESTRYIIIIKNTIIISMYNYALHIMPLLR